MTREKLTPKKIKLLDALFTEPSIKGAYSKAGVSVATGDRYRRESAFRREYESRKRYLITATSDHLRALSGKAVDILKEVLESPDASDSDRIRAAKTVLDTTYKNVEIEELRKQVEELENKMNGGFNNEYWEFAN